MAKYGHVRTVITIVWTMKSQGQRRDLKGQHGHQEQQQAMLYDGGV